MYYLELSIRAVNGWAQANPPPSRRRMELDLSCSAAMPSRRRSLMLIQSWPIITPVLHRYEMPSNEWDVYTVRDLLFWLYLAWASLYCRRRSRALCESPKDYRSRCCLVCVFQHRLATALAWLDFAGRDVNFRLPGPIQSFFDQHSQLEPLSIGLWVVLTPGARI